MPEPCRTGDAIIQVNHVHKHFKRVHAVNDLSLTINRGEFVALLGPNGAGKTTLVEMIEGLQLPDQGAITVLGTNWKKNETYLRSKIGLALQETRLIDKLTVKETLELFASFYGRSFDICQDIIKLVSLEEKASSYVETLSGGQKQRLAIGISIINQPEILILDEPTIGLDPHARREIWGILHALKKRCTTLILTTHYMEEAEMLCDRICIIHKGQVLTQGTLSELLAAHSDGEVIEFQLDGLQDDQLLNALPGVLKYQWDSDSQQGSLTVKNAISVLPAFYRLAEKQSMAITQLTIRKKTLDDLFISLTGRRLDE